MSSSLSSWPQRPENPGFKVRDVWLQGFILRWRPTYATPQSQNITNRTSITQLHFRPGVSKGHCMISQEPFLNSCENPVLFHTTHKNTVVCGVFLVCVGGGGVGTTRGPQQDFWPDAQRLILCAIVCEDGRGRGQQPRGTAGPAQASAHPASSLQIGLGALVSLTGIL